MASKKKKKGKKRKGTAKRSAARRPKKKKAKAGHRCSMCGHSARHGKAGCLHHDGNRFCSCKHRG